MVVHPEILLASLAVTVFDTFQSVDCLFIPLIVTLSLFSFSGDHPEASSNSLVETISGFWQLPREPPHAHAFGAFSLPEKTSQWVLAFLAKPLPFT
jgi:hypothetical protein